MAAPPLRKRNPSSFFGRRFALKRVPGSGRRQYTISPSARCATSPAKLRFNPSDFSTRPEDQLVAGTPYAKFVAHLQWQITANGKRVLELKWGRVSRIEGSLSFELGSEVPRTQVRPSILMHTGNVDDYSGLLQAQ